MPNYEADLDRVFQALSNSARRAILARLVRSPTSVGKLAELVTMSLPAVLQHLQVLQDCGLVTTSKVGRVRTCSVDLSRLRTAEAWLHRQRTATEQQLDRLGEHLEASPHPTVRPDPPERT